MNANTLDDVLENDRVSLNAAILDEEKEVRARIIELKKTAYENKEKRDTKAKKKVLKKSQDERLAAAYKASNIVLDEGLDPDEEVTKSTFYERLELLKQKSDLMDNTIKSAQENCNSQIFLFDDACKILFQLRRLETCCAKFEKWAGQNYTDEYDATQAEIDLTEEQLIADHIRGLLDKRDEELGRIEVVMNKIQTASETLKRGFQVNKTITADGQLTEGARTYERTICLEDDSNYVFDDIYDKSEFMSKRTKDRLRRFRRERNEQYCKNRALKTAIKNDTMLLETETYLDRRAFADSLMYSDGFGCVSSAVLKSTLDTLTHQLELEQEMPCQTANNQFAISDRANNVPFSKKEGAQVENNFASPYPRSPHIK
eukprot:Tbor_TRINITY_DN4556_c0_g1::TRINITY_DN4556_c0_g1_i1::g.15858::m.15858